MDEAIRILLVADTHIGLDWPARPRVKRRRRGPDFIDNFRRALAPAREGRVDLVVHGGDLLFRSKVSAGLVRLALAPLMEVADLGVPVFLVPGNHERSRIPYPLLAAHAHLHIFERPRTFTWTVRGTRLALAGFPFVREVRREFGAVLRATGHAAPQADVRLLCMHQAVEGARVGVQDFTFRDGADVIRGADLPGDVAAVLSGHIHRAQRLTRDLRGRRLPAPVVYPGSVERTSFAERREVKGSVRLVVGRGRCPGGRLHRATFAPLPTRPMEVVEIDALGLSAPALRRRLGEVLGTLDPDAVVRLRVRSAQSCAAGQVLRAEVLRELAPKTMNLTLSGQARGGTLFHHPAEGALPEADPRHYPEGDRWGGEFHAR